MTEPVAGVYLDTNAFVYAVQAETDMASPMLRLFSELARLGQKPVTSELTLAELLCKRNLTPALHDIYVDLLVESETIHLEGVTRQILLESAEMRRTGSTLKLQDAIHVATALRASCKFMLTNDAGIGAHPDALIVLRPTHENVDRIIGFLNV